jgi:hypothetical protein
VRPKISKFKNTKKAEDQKEPPVPREESKVTPKTVVEPKTTLKTERPEEETKRPSAFGSARTERPADRPPSKFVNKGIQERLQASMTTGSTGAEDKPRTFVRSDIKPADQPTAQPEVQPQRKKITSSKKISATQDKPERKTSEPDAEGFITVKK